MQSKTGGGREKRQKPQVFRHGGRGREHSSLPEDGKGEDGETHAVTSVERRNLG